MITGLLPGRSVARATKEAGKIEEEFDDIFLSIKGFRRDAWIKPQNIQTKHDKENKRLVVQFTLPKSSYATVFIEALANKNFHY